MSEHAAALERVASALERAVDDQLDCLAPDFFFSPDPCTRHLSGRLLAARRFLERVANSCGQALASMLLDHQKAIKAFSEAALAELGSVSLAEAVCIVAQMPGGLARLRWEFLDLLELARKTAEFDIHARIDPRMTTCNMRLGLPDGPSDSLAELLGPLLHMQTFFRSFEPDTVEIVYYAAPISAEQLRLYISTAGDYLSIPENEREQLLQYPKPSRKLLEPAVRGDVRAGSNGQRNVAPLPAWEDA